MRQRVYISWRTSAFFGWGVYGLNLALQWSADPDVRPVGTVPTAPDELGCDPLRARALGGFLADSAAFQARLTEFAGRDVTVEGPVLHFADHRFAARRPLHDVKVDGKPSVSVTFFETAKLEADALARAAAYPLVVAGSTWNAEILKAQGLTNVQLVLQGVDASLFRPAPRTGLFKDRFLVFSGGKVERRKGQDIVLAAFARFVARHPDAVLVTAWQSPAKGYAPTVDQSGLAAPVVLTPSGDVAVTAWAQASGVPAANILDLGQIPNSATPQVLAEMDVAVFPNRAEGGTNLVAMEAMACGVPVILSANTGHLDLIEGDNCLPLNAQGQLGGAEAGFGGVAGWGESDVDEVVDALERAYAEREALRRIGERGAAFMQRLTWAETARRMKGLILS